MVLTGVLPAWDLGRCGVGLGWKKQTAGAARTNSPAFWLYLLANTNSAEGAVDWERPGVKVWGWEGIWQGRRQALRGVWVCVLWGGQEFPSCSNA